MTVARKPVEETITIAEIEAFLQKAAKCVEELLRAASQLPKVDENGSSECPFAEELYAKKEEAQKKVQQCLPQLNIYRGWVGQEINRCKKNLVVISAHQDMLNRDRPRRYFSQAETKLAALYKKLLTLREKIDQMIKKIQEALREAAQKQYPGKIPQKDRYSSLAPSAFEQPSEQDTSDIDRDLRQMLRKGPTQ